jgi:arylsulfatase A-like enzyme
MRILYLDIDSLRPDHLGCYGYSRPTSPNLDRLAARGVRFTRCYTPDAPCLPSRTALFSGRCGWRTGVVNHGGVAAQPRVEGPDRQFRDWFGLNAWPALLRKRGLHTATISPFGERHSAWHWYAGFSEIHNTGQGGMESAEEVSPVALDWIARNARRENWFLHVNFWDPHTPYRAPAELGNPFADMPPPAWLTEEVRARHWASAGPHGAREVTGYSSEGPAGWAQRYPRQLLQAPDMAAVRAMFDGYDAGVRWADEHAGRVLNALADAGVLDDTAIVVSSDHGENLGELNVYGDHQTADDVTCRVPLLVRWPGITDGQAGRVDDAFHYHFDFAATALELLGGAAPGGWDGRGFAAALRAGRSEGRDHLVLSQSAWCAQRAVRWGDHLYLRTYHDAWHDYPDEMLFDLARDPHETRDLAPSSATLVAEGRRRLEAWKARMRDLAPGAEDPIETALAEGGPLHTREGSSGYLERLRQTGRSAIADRLARKHGAARAREDA